jgi:hypothetical protein
VRTEIVECGAELTFSADKSISSPCKADRFETSSEKRRQTSIFFSGERD